MAHIVLAHGILGFGHLSTLGHGIYSNGITALYCAAGHDVLEPAVDALGSLETRSKQLADAISKWPNDEPIHIVAHSMGGLNAGA